MGMAQTDVVEHKVTAGATGGGAAAVVGTALVLALQQSFPTALPAGTWDALYVAVPGILAAAGSYAAGWRAPHTQRVDVAALFSDVRDDPTLEVNASDIASRVVDIVEATLERHAPQFAANVSIAATAAAVPAAARAITAAATAAGVPDPQDGGNPHG